MTPARPFSSGVRPRTRDRTRKYAASALAVAVLILLWGGYARGWGWTGCPGSTLWGWLRLLLLPLVVPTLLIPALFSRISGSATQPDQEAKAGAPSVRDRPGLTVPASATGSQS